jgi:hypothetical protein
MLKRKINKNFLLASIKAALEILFRLSFSLIGQFSQVYKSRVIGLLEDFLELVSDFKEAT